MQLSPFLPTAVSVAVPLAQRVTQRLADGLTFAHTLAERITGGNIDPQPGPSAEVRDDADALANLPTSWVNAHRTAQQRLQEFLNDFRTLAALSGIDTSPPITLKSDGRQGVIVAGDHPERAAIEEHLRRQPELAAKFHRLAAAQTVAAQAGQSFGQRVRGEFQLSIGQLDAAVRFE